MTFQSMLITGHPKGAREELMLELVRELLGTSDLEHNPDSLTLEAEEGKNSIGIDEVREIKKYLQIKPFGTKRIVLIKEAQTLTPEAQNALLKLLEEPPSYAHLILSVPDKSFLLPTVVSRCAEIGLPSGAADINPELKEALGKEFIELLNSAEGQRLDWVTDNEKRIKNDEIFTMLEAWAMWLKEQSDQEYQRQNYYVFKEITNTLKLLYEGKADRRLIMEVFLLGLPRVGI